jgi:hypothetical protein
MKKLIIVLILCVLPILAYSEFNPSVQEDVALSESGFTLPDQHPENGPFRILGNRSDIPSSTAAFKPSISITEALGAAQSYVRTQGVDVSGQYIHSVRLNHDEGSTRQGYYWHVQWAWSAPRTGGEYSLRIYTDGTIVPAPPGS